MHVKKKITLACSVLLIGIGGAALPAGAQSLGLSYDLEVRRDSVERVALPSSQCSGLDWLNSFAPCARDGDPVLLSPAEETTAAPAAGMRRVTVGPGGAAVPSAIPHQAFAGDGSPDSRLRSPNGTRTPDVSLRFGSKNRPLLADEGRDGARFIDAPYESYVHSNAHKAIGLEVLVPFQ